MCRTLLSWSYGFFKAVEIDLICDAIGSMQGGLFLYENDAAFIKPIAFVEYLYDEWPQVFYDLLPFFFRAAIQGLVSESDVYIAIFHYFNGYPVNCRIACVQAVFHLLHAECIVAGLFAADDGEE